MGIPETQLETWSKQGSITQSKATYESVKATLESSSAPYSEHLYSSFLQGSYGNDTNIYADSDVDIVMRLDGTFQHDLDSLTELEKADFHKSYANANYTLQDFKKDVTAWLTQKYGSDVKPGTKAIFIAGNGNRRDTDVLPCCAFRRYHKFKGLSDESYAEGICFYSKDGTKIVNFPKQHSANCTLKHQATGQWLKPMVRILKNMRNNMIDKGMIEEGLAPSYYLEGLLYNVPNEKFGVSYEDSFVNAFNWILEADRSQFVCANEQYYLLREGSPVTWRDGDCTKFLNAAADLWKQW